MVDLLLPPLATKSAQSDPFGTGRDLHVRRQVIAAIFILNDNRFFIAVVDI